MLADDVAAGRLARLACTAPAMRTNNGLLYLRERTLAPSARLFMQTLKQLEAEDQAADLPPRRGAARVRKADAGRPRPAAA